MESFAIRNLTFFYPAAKAPALENINVSIGQGEFLVLCGPSGCGKSTLLRQLKPDMAPHGKKAGEILFEGVLLSAMNRRDQSAKIGFVMQSPENQIVTDKVWHELAFGLESLGFDQETIRLRVAEMASFFGIEEWFYKSTAELSGGQKQLLNLASIMAMHPTVLILDEPTSQLDPIAAADFLAAVGRINRELGTTVIITEHRLEEIFPFADRVLVMDQGRMICDASPAEAGARLKADGHSMFLAMPTPMRIWAAVPGSLPCPVTVRDGRQWVSRQVEERGLPALSFEASKAVYGETVVELDQVWFRYEKNSPDVLRGLSLTVQRGEFVAILGGNGAGKSTVLALMSGRKKPYRGSVKIGGWVTGSAATGSTTIGVLPQNPQALFLKKTVQEDLQEILPKHGLTKEQKEKKLQGVIGLCRLEKLLHMHPYDLSGGEQQRAALAKVLLTEPEILMLDEPTKGLDAEFKVQFAEILEDLLAGGATIIMVSHDVEFCAMYAHRCAMVFDGIIVSAGTPRRFFAGNSFYTTSANRMARHLIPEIITAEDVIKACGGLVPEVWTEPEPDSNAEGELKSEAGEELISAAKSGVSPASAPDPIIGKRLWGKWLRGHLDALMAFLFLIPTAYGIFKNGDEIRMLISGGEIADRMAQNVEGAWKYAALLVFLCVELCVIWNRFRKRPNRELLDYQVPPGNRMLTKRTVAAIFVVLLAIPLTILFGQQVLGDRQYYFVSMMIIFETMIPFILTFEGRKPQARELVIISVLCAIGVAGRAAFFMLPQFKPVIAVVIIAGVAFGGEAGFLVGVITGFVSNFFYGQGPWSPMQMFAFGIIGFLAGVLFQKGVLRRDRIALCVFGAFATLVVYGSIMDVAAVLIFQNTITKQMVLAAYVQGIPFNIVHSISTFFFLWVIAEPLLEKLDRVKLKYGLLAPARGVDTAV